MYMRRRKKELVFSRFSLFFLFGINKTIYRERIGCKNSFISRRYFVNVCRSSVRGSLDTLTTSHTVHKVFISSFFFRSFVSCTFIYINRNVTYIFLFPFAVVVVFHPFNSLQEKKISSQIFSSRRLESSSSSFQLFRFGQCNAIPLNLIILLFTYFFSRNLLSSRSSSDVNHPSLSQSLTHSSRFFVACEVDDEKRSIKNEFDRRYLLCL